MVEKTLSVPTNFDVEQVEAAVKALRIYAAKIKEESIFLDASIRLMLDVRTFKIPGGEDHFFNIRLPHTPYADLTELDVLLVVPDVKDRDPDHVVGEVKDALSSSSRANLIKVREVLTLKQFRDNYSVFEAKRALSKSVDVVIAENKIWKMIPSILGREFMKKKKFPLGIPGRKFTKNDIGEQIWLALHKTVLNLSLKGQNSTVVVGPDTLSEDKLTENVKSIVSWLNKSFPGGWSNIQRLSLHIGQSNVPTLPIYFSSGTTNDVKKRPRTKGEKDTEPLEEEITTQLGKRMKVFPDGKINVLKSEDRDELDDIL